MEKQLMMQIGLELCSSLIRAGLELARTLGVEEDKLDAALRQAKEEFLKNDPSNITFGG